MVELQLGDQTIRFDREATVAAYRGVERGCAEECGCEGCGVYLSLREAILPPAFLVLLERLGIDVTKETEAFDFGEVEDGRTLFSGWFVFVGELVSCGESVVTDPAAPGFGWFFGKSFPALPGFEGQPQLAVEFVTAAKTAPPARPTAPRAE